MESNNFENCDRYMKLKIFIEDDTLKQQYVKASLNHNSKMSNLLYDAGFDIFSPIDYEISDNIKLHKLDFQIICAAEMVLDNNKQFNTGFYMYPRSSISKSNVRLANNVGIIDAGYRGHLIGMFDLVYPNGVNNIINKFERHLQICAPGLIPIVVELVNSREELGEETTRGSGGFGSTGI